MKVLLLISFITYGLSITALSQNAAFRQKSFNLDNGIAIQGYDPVAYFKQGKAVKGKNEFNFSDQGIIYYFSSLENKETFTKNPSGFEPVYGGWCAYAMGAKGEKVTIDPATFKIVGDRLYLFYNKFFNNTLKDWNKDETNLKARADANWQKLLN